MNNNIDVISAINQHRKPVPKSREMFRLMILLHNDGEENGHYWFSGTRIGGIDVERKPREVVRVRLNTVEERIEDEKRFSRKSLTEITKSVKKQYETGANKRKTLFEHSKSNARLFSFERVKFLYEKDGVNYYRAHWTSSISNSNDALFVQGLGHIRLIKENRAIGRNEICQAEIIESVVQQASKKNVTSNNEIMAKALSSKDPLTNNSTAQRTGKLMIEMVNSSGRNLNTIDIYNEKKAVEAQDSNTGMAKTVNVPASYEETLKAYSTATDFHTKRYKEDPSNDYYATKALEADLNRQILGFLLGWNVVNLPIVRNDLADNVIKPFANSIHKGEITLNLYAVRIYHYGKNHKANILKSFERRGLYKHYTLCFKEDGTLTPYIDTMATSAIAAYTPTALGLQKYDDGTLYVVFDAAVDLHPSNYQLITEVQPEDIQEAKDFVRI